MTHAHITSWALTLILFFVVLYLEKSAKAKGAKIVHMILRVFYILTIATGAQLLIGAASLPFLYIVKILLGVLTIGFFEMVLVRGKKGKPTNVFWILLIISLIATITLGFTLPI
ncbi:YisL family protein [Bacillus sp. PS06]|uniref:YisL family protein n=1 Tax=Bacillus sp. PS06 TaxID=2764176 RepID=UPI001784D3EF|nr:YisL family protein [Bacillus sp. PS06]MBD8067587.1 YisL family protein [Bacillus sp. PS06]